MFLLTKPCLSPLASGLQHEHNGELTKRGNNGTPNSVTHPDAAERNREFYADIAIQAETFARVVAFAMSQPEKRDVNEILFRPTRQEL